MYVTGRGTNTFGTIFPSIIEFQRINKIRNFEVIFAGHNFSNIQKSKKKALKALKISEIDFSKINFKVSFYPNKKNKKQTYKDILKNEKNLSCAIVAVPDHLHYQVTFYDHLALINLKQYLRYHCFQELSILPHPI